MGTREFAIRQAMLSDVDIIADLATRTFKSAYESMLSGEALETFITSTFSQGSIRAELSDPTNKFLLAFEGSKALGYGMLREGHWPAGVTRSKPVELARIYLVEEVIGGGYGTALMKACLDTAEASGYETIWLGVWEENKRAIRFYEKWGFTRVGSHPFEFGDEVHTDLVMARSIR